MKTRSAYDTYKFEFCNEIQKVKENIQLYQIIHQIKFHKYFNQFLTYRTCKSWFFCAYLRTDIREELVNKNKSNLKHLNLKLITLILKHSLPSNNNKC